MLRVEPLKISMRFRFDLLILVECFLTWERGNSRCAPGLGGEPIRSTIPLIYGPFSEPGELENYLYETAFFFAICAVSP